MRLFNFTLYKRDLREMWKQLVLFAALLALYFTVIISMFDPALGGVLTEFAAAMPEMMAMFGMTADAATLTYFLASYLYGFLMLVIPMAVSILLANRLMARHVDRGSMAWLLAAPAGRTAVAFTQMKALFTGLFALISFATVLGIAASGIYFPGELDIGAFLILNLGVLCLHVFIAGICFLCACAFDDAKHSTALGAGIPALSFLLQMMAQAGEKLENIKYATFFTLFDPNGLIAGTQSAYLGIGILFTAGAVLFVTAIVIFSKRDLHI